MKSTPLLLLLPLLFLGCGKPGPSEPPPTLGSELATVFAAEFVEGPPIPIPEARTAIAPGESVTLEGKIMGVMHPFVDGRAAFVLGDPATITSCDLMGDDDHCTTPWDACCDPSDIKQAGTATIQVVDAEGQVVRQGLEGVHGLENLARVRVTGTLAPGSSESTMIVNATGIRVVRE